MTRWLNSGVGGFGLLAFASAMGCEAQVDDDYEGEPLLSLQGHVVVSEEQADSNLVPHLAFFDLVDDRAVVLVDGQLTGEFPAKFRFDVTKPPPASALGGPWPQVGLKGKAAFGALVLRPANDKTPIISYLETQPEYECSGDGLTCTKFEVGCLDDGCCRERVYECTDRPCELVEQWGDSALRSSLRLSTPRRTRRHVCRRHPWASWWAERTSVSPSRCT